MVAHALRTPLTGPGGSLGIEETTHRLMSGIYAAVERMQRLVADPDEGRLTLRFIPVDVFPLLADACMQAQSQHLAYQVPPGLPALHGDAAQHRRKRPEVSPSWRLGRAENCERETGVGPAGDPGISPETPFRLSLSVSIEPIPRVPVNPGTWVGVVWDSLSPENVLGLTAGQSPSAGAMVRAQP